VHRNRELISATRVACRRATLDDVEFCEEVHVAALGPVALVGYGWTADRLRAQFHSEVKLATCQVIMVDRVDVGYVSVEDHGSYWYIDAIAIVPKYQKRGVGAATMHLVMADAGLRPVRLSVLRTNRARSLYLRLGFRIVASDRLREQMEWRATWP
jgi:ribosomal protein S18 acetylase RimI-like enzyme